MVDVSHINKSFVYRMKKYFERRVEAFEEYLRLMDSDEKELVEATREDVASEIMAAYKKLKVDMIAMRAETDG